MKTKLLILILFLTIKVSVAQQLGDGYAPPISDFSAILTSGMYTGGSPNGSIPEGGWQHLLVVRHGNPNNNYQFQIGSSINENDKLYFRKIANGGLTAVNPVWNELATRGTNVFNGNQIFNGQMQLKTFPIMVGTESSSENSVRFATFYDANVNWRSINFGKAPGIKQCGELAFKFVADNSDQNHISLGMYGHTDDQRLYILGNGNVGIGTVTPGNYKLNVWGTIRAHEIVVNNTGADFVFEPTYKLRTLSELETFIRTNKHLPDIAPAKEMQENGVSAGEMQAKLLQKVEELTLYVIEKDKEIAKLKAEKDNQLAEQQKLLMELKKEIEILKTK